MFKATDTRTFVTRRSKTLAFSLLGFGSAPLGNFPRALSEDECDATVGRAWERGLRTYDTAPLYGLGLSETRIGRNLRQHARGDYLLSTKVGRLLEPLAPGETFDAGIYKNVPRLKYVYDYSYDGVMR
ncbi:MAG: aldo/keto reductase, partial [Alphaproteobacteria bacterium]|nr:aldo/keto reductase [Alphaproteobacteria bacterium]